MAEKLVFCKGGGCTAKLGAGVLERVLSRLPKGPSDSNLLVGFDSKDDAAANALSDVFAMGPLHRRQRCEVWAVRHGRPWKPLWNP